MKLLVVTAEHEVELPVPEREAHAEDVDVVVDLQGLRVDASVEGFA